MEDKYEVKTDNFGTIRYYKNGKLHRDNDLPAVEWNNGDKEWHKEWHKEGKIHRIDDPAIEDNYGNKHWYKEGKKHRDNGPAVEYFDGDKLWYYEGKYINCSKVGLDLNSSELFD